MHWLIKKLDTGYPVRTGYWISGRIPDIKKAGLSGRISGAFLVPGIFRTCSSKIKIAFGPTSIQVPVSKQIKIYYRYRKIEKPILYTESCPNSNSSNEK
jgi:hypothetical protein